MDVLFGYSRLKQSPAETMLLQYNTRKFLVKVIPAAKSRRRATPPPAAKQLRARLFLPILPVREKVRDIYIDSRTERLYDDKRVKFEYNPSNSAREVAQREGRFRLELEKVVEDSRRFREEMSLNITQRCKEISGEAHTFRRKRALNRWRWLRRLVLFWLRTNKPVLGALRLPVEPFAGPLAAEFLEATRFGRTSRVAQLLAMQPSLLFERDFFHLTALHWAAKRDKAETLLVLLAGQAYLDCEDKYGLTPLHYAVRESAFTTAQVLLAAGASPWSSGAQPLLSGGNASPGLARLVKTFRRFHIAAALVPRAERQRLFRRLVREKFNDERLNQIARFIG